MRKKQALPEKLNICIVATKFPIVGRAAAHGFLWFIAKGLVEKGHNVKVLSSQSPLGKPELTKDGVHIFFLQQPNSVYAKIPYVDALYEKFIDLNRESPFHLVHSIDASAIKIARNKKIHQVALAYDAEATHMSQLISILAMAQETLKSLLATSLALIYKYLTTYLGSDRQLLKTADGIFVTSPQQRLFIERYYLYPDARIYTIPYGIEMSDLSPREKSEELKKNLNIPDDSKVVVTITDMTEVGEMTSILDAFQKVSIKKPSARMIVVGYGPKFKEIEYHMLNLALGSKVIMTGAVKNQDLPDYITLADIFIDISSRSSGFETSMLEAMLQKKVIIGSEMSPISTIVENAIDGFLVRPADVESIANLIIDIFSGELGVNEMGENARRKIMKMFDTNRMVNETLNAYKSILKDTGYYKK